MTGFSFTSPARTIFGRDSRFEAAQEVAGFGQRVLVVRGRSVPWVDELVSELSSGRCAVQTVHSKGEPDLEDVRRGVAVAREFGAECVVAVGGGATIDLGKAIAGLCASEGDAADYLEIGNASVRRLNDPLPYVAIPTTAGTGAEATRNAVIGVPERQAKISLRDPRLVPDLAIVDPALTDGAPKILTLATGLDALTQLIESYLSRGSTIVTDALCRSAIPAAIAALRQLAEADDPDARDTMAMASHLSGLALANSGLGIVHGLASVIGGRGGSHGAICGRLLAPALVVNRQNAQQMGLPVARFDEVGAWLAEGLGQERGSGIWALKSFTDTHEIPGLTDLNVPESDFAQIAQAALSASSTRANPVVLSVSEIARILKIAC